MPADEKGRLKAEARCLKVARIVVCFLHYGGIPILSRSLGLVFSKETVSTQNTVEEECVDYMVSQNDK
jgi:hypothetical protein